MALVFQITNTSWKETSRITNRLIAEDQIHVVLQIFRSTNKISLLKFFILQGYGYGYANYLEFECKNYFHELSSSCMNYPILPLTQSEKWIRVEVFFLKNVLLFWKNHFQKYLKCLNLKNIVLKINFWNTLKCVLLGSQRPKL